MTTTKPFQLGSVSTGTLRTEDLLPALVDALRSLRGDQYRGIVARAQLVLGSDLEDWEQYAQESLEDIREALNTLCPPFVYFGAHPSDGADFGFWPDWDALDACEELQYGHDIAWTDEYGCMVERVGDDKVTVMDRDRNILWSTV